MSVEFPGLAEAPAGAGLAVAAGDGREAVVVLVAAAPREIGEPCLRYVCFAIC